MTDHRTDTLDGLVPILQTERLLLRAPAKAEGKGYATEAAGAALGCAFGTLGVATLVSYVDAANLRSIAVAERLGAVRDATAAGPDPEDLVYRHTAQGAT